MSEQRFAIFCFVSFLCFCFLVFAAAFVWNGNDEFHRASMVIAMSLFTYAGILILGGKKATCRVKKD